MWNQVINCRCSMNVLIDHCLQSTDQYKKESWKGTDLIFKPNCYIYSSSSTIEDLGKMLWPYLTGLFSIKTLILRAGEMAQRLRALPALPKVLSSIPSNHMVAHNHL